MKKKKFDTFGQKLKFMLFERELTQAALSELSGISLPTISSWVYDKRIPSIPSFMIVADALELTNEEIIDLLKTFRVT